MDLFFPNCCNFPAIYCSFKAFGHLTASKSTWDCMWLIFNRFVTNNFVADECCCWTGPERPLRDSPGLKRRNKSSNFFQAFISNVCLEHWPEPYMIIRLCGHARTWMMMLSRLIADTKYRFSVFLLLFCVVCLSHMAHKTKMTLSGLTLCVWTQWKRLFTLLSKHY